MANKKCVEFDARVQQIIQEVYADFLMYLPMPQDKNVYKRKQKEYMDIIIARIREELNDGRTADDPAAGL